MDYPFSVGLVALGCTLALALWLLSRSSRPAVALGLVFLLMGSVLLASAAKMVWPALETRPFVGSLQLLVFPVAVFAYLAFEPWTPETARRRHILVVGAVLFVVGVLVLSFFIPCAWECPRALPWAEPWLRYGWLSPLTTWWPMLGAFLVWALVRRNPAMLGEGGMGAAAFLCVGLVQRGGILAGQLVNYGFDAPISYLSNIPWALGCAAGAYFLVDLARRALRPEGEHGPSASTLWLLALLAFVTGYFRPMEHLLVLFQLCQVIVPLGAWWMLLRHRTFNPTTRLATSPS